MVVENCHTAVGLYALSKLVNRFTMSSQPMPSASAVVVVPVNCWQSCEPTAIERDEWSDGHRGTETRV